MGRDLPDGTRKMVLEFSGGLVGLEELAVRLGSIVPFNLQGNVLLMEDFENGITEWVIDTLGVGSAVTQSSTRKYAGAYSLKMVANIGGSGYAQAYRTLHYPGATKVGTFCRVLLDENSDTFALKFPCYDGTYSIEVGAKYDRVNTRLSVGGDIGGWTVVDSALSLGGDDLTWYPILLLFDLEQMFYDRVIVGAEEYDISNVAIAQAANAQPLSASVLLLADTPGGGSWTTYADDVVVAGGVP